MMTAAAAGLIAGGAALGRTVHAGYMATLDDRDALAGKVEALGKGLERALARAAATEAERDAARARANELAAALEGSSKRCESLGAELQEVARLNISLQRRLERAEAKVQKTAAAKADAEARAAAARSDAAAACESAARWEREAGVMVDRLMRVEGRNAALEKDWTGRDKQRAAP